MLNEKIITTLILAPFRSIIQDREKRSVDQSESLLFFGCRHPEKDLYFKDEFGSLRRFNAFSRLEEKKQYVQDVIAENSQLVFDKIMSGAVVLIAGKAQDMPDQVKEALIDAFEKHGQQYGMDRDSGKQLLDVLEEQGRLQQETW